MLLQLLQLQLQDAASAGAVIGVNAGHRRWALL
jgi:hypothetical protein